MVEGGSGGYPVWLEAARAFLPDELMQALYLLPASELSCAEELRQRADRPGVLVARAARHPLPALDSAGMQGLIARLSRRSLYALERQLGQGYIPLGAGFRAGVCGRVVTDGGEVRSMQDISGVCIRIAREIPGCADRLMPYILDGESTTVRSTLIVSAPGMGKTTLLRDIVRQISDRGIDVAIADERSELAATYMAAPQLDVGANTDVLDGCPKRVALPMLIRTMRPSVIATDEIGDPSDADAIRDAARCGVAVLATAHGASLAEVSARSTLGGLIGDGTFARIALLGKRPGNVCAIYNEKGERI